MIHIYIYIYIYYLIYLRSAKLSPTAPTLRPKAPAKSP